MITLARVLLVHVSDFSCPNVLLRWLLLHCRSWARAAILGDKSHLKWLTRARSTRAIMADANWDPLCVVSESDTGKTYDRSMTFHLLNPIVL